MSKLAQQKRPVASGYPDID